MDSTIATMPAAAEIPPGGLPFAPIDDADRERAAAIPTGAVRDEGGKDPDAVNLMPCPDADPMPGTFRHWLHGMPSRLWVYRDAGGAPLVVAARYEFPREDGTPGKVVTPWSYGFRRWIDKNGKQREGTGWHPKAPPVPRPLYGLDRLAARPNAAVLVCEGEKSADAAALLFPDMICIASQGGSTVPGKSDWAPLAGRRVTIWPDNDEPGAAYAEKVADMVRLAGAEPARIVEVPTAWPAGWDLADDLPEGVTHDYLRELLGDALDGAVKLPTGFRMTSAGLFFDVPAPPDKEPPAPIWVAAPFRVIGETRNEASESWGLMLRWVDRDGTPHQWAIPRRLIHRPGNEIAEELEHAGLACGPDAQAHTQIKRFIGGVRAGRRMCCVDRTGWHDAEGAAVFVLPGGEAFGRGASNVILQTEHASSDAAYRRAGTLEGWQRGVAALAVGNDRLALFVSAAFTGPLLNIVNEPSGGLHLVGTSRTGKSTAAVAAASVWGKPAADAQMRSWRGTSNGLEGTGAATSDTLLVLDEMGQSSANEVGDVVYMLANEAGKQRASRTGAARRRQSWRVLFLSTGELTLAQKMGEAGKRAAAGLAVRLVDLPADAGAGLGVFQTLHGHAGGAALVAALRDAARQHHGTAARVFLARLARDLAGDGGKLREALAALRGTFLARFLPAGATGQVQSVAGRFALIAAAGELARDYGVLPWPKGEAMRAAGACFRVWLAERGGAGPAEDAAALAQVRAFLELHGEARFTKLTGQDDEASEASRTVNRAGFRRKRGDGWEYLVLPEAWKAEVCRGFDPSRVADLLAARGLLHPGKDGKRADSVKISGEGKRRVYRLSDSILDAEGGADGTR